MHVAIHMRTEVHILDTYRPHTYPSFLLLFCFFFFYCFCFAFILFFLGLFLVLFLLFQNGRLLFFWLLLLSFSGCGLFFFFFFSHCFFFFYFSLFLRSRLNPFHKFSSGTGVVYAGEKRMDGQASECPLLIAMLGDNIIVGSWNHTDGTARWCELDIPASDTKLSGADAAYIAFGLQNSANRMESGWTWHVVRLLC